MSAADLKGKSVAVLEGGLILDLYLGIWLEQNGVSIKDVTFTNLIMDDAMAAMLSGKVAGAEFWEPYAKNVKENCWRQGDGRFPQRRSGTRTACSPTPCICAKRLHRRG